VQSARVCVENRKRKTDEPQPQRAKPRKRGEEEKKVNATIKSNNNEHTNTPTCHMCHTSNKTDNGDSGVRKSIRNNNKHTHSNNYTLVNLFKQHRRQMPQKFEKKVNKEIMFTKNSPEYSKVNYDSDSDQEEDDFIQRQIKHQQLQIKKQDEGLEMLSKSADRLGQLSFGIHEELNQQNKMLDEMDDELEKATSNLDYVTRRTKDLIDKSGGKRNFLFILALSGIVILLLFLIIYT
jgi:glutaredoxin